MINLKAKKQQRRARCQLVLSTRINLKREKTTTTAAGSRRSRLMTLVANNYETLKNPHTFREE